MFAFLNIGRCFLTALAISVISRSILVATVTLRVIAIDIDAKPTKRKICKFPRIYTNRHRKDRYPGKEPKLSPMMGHDWKRSFFIAIFQQRRQFATLHADVVKIINGKTLRDAFKRSNIRDETNFAVFYPNCINDKPIANGLRTYLSKRTAAHANGERGNVSRVVSTILPIGSRASARQYRGGDYRQDSLHRAASFVPSVFVVAKSTPSTKSLTSLR